MNLRDDLFSDESDQEDASRGSSEESAPQSDDEMWGDLLSGVTYDDEEPEEEEETAPGDGRRLTTVQRVILGILGIIVLAVWGVVILMVARSLPAERAPETTAVSPADSTPMGTSDANTPDATLSPASEEADAGSSQPTVTPTPTPAPPVSTVYDIQIQENPDNMDLYLQRGREYLSLGAYEAAREDFQKARSLDKERAEAYVGLGWANYYLARWDAAESAFGTAVAFDQNLANAHFGLGKVLFYQQRYEGAAEGFDWAAEIDRGDAEAEAWLAIASAHMNDEVEAMGAATRALSITQEIPLPYIGRSWAFRVQDPPDLERAHGDLIYARNLAPNDFHALNALARFYLEHRPERMSEAEQLAVYARNWAEDPIQEAVALQTLGRIYLAQSRAAEARNALNQAADRVTHEGRIVLGGLAEDLERARTD